MLERIVRLWWWLYERYDNWRFMRLSEAEQLAELEGMARRVIGNPRAPYAFKQAVVAAMQALREVDDE